MKLTTAIDRLADRLHDYTQADCLAEGEDEDADVRDLAEALCFLHIEVEQAMRQLENTLTETNDA